MALAVSVTVMPARAATEQQRRPFARVLLITIDGAHASDLARYVRSRPHSTLARLSRHGTTYTNATTPVSDSVPGLVAIVAGATPNSSGIPYIPWYDRKLSAPGSDCSRRGTTVAVSDKYNIDPLAEDAGGGLDVSKLPRDPDRSCTPVWPRALLRVNTVFEVIKASGGGTAWVDQHVSYLDLISGPGGDALDDPFAPDGSPARHSLSYQRLVDQDASRVAAVRNQIRGRDHTGAHPSKVPTLFGLSFITFNAVQKKNGYLDGRGRPTPELNRALDFIDNSIGRLVADLRAYKLEDGTMIIVTSKHGQSPIDPAQRRIVARSVLPALVEKAAPGGLAQLTQDSGAYIWLKDPRRSQQVAEVLRAAGARSGIAKVDVGQGLHPRFPDPASDPRAPDIVVEATPGVMFADRDDPKKAEHGGFSPDDLSVPLLVSRPHALGRTVKSPVVTTQVAPTILQALGLSPEALLAVRIEKTRALPEF